MEKIKDTAILLFASAFFACMFIGMAAAVNYAKQNLLPISYYVDIESVVGEDMVVGERLQDFTITRDVSREVSSELVRELNLYREDNTDTFVCNGNLELIFQDGQGRKQTFVVDYDQAGCPDLDAGTYYWVFEYTFPLLNDRSEIIRSNQFRVWTKEEAANQE